MAPVSPATGRWIDARLRTPLLRYAAVQASQTSREGHTSTQLADGRVLIAGGDASGSAEIFDPATGQSTSLTAKMMVARAYHSAVLLDDGRVLIVGGYVAGTSSVEQSSEVFDPSVATFVKLASLTSSARVWPTLTLRNDHVVRIDGGDAISSLEYFDPATATFGTDPAAPDVKTDRDDYAPGETVTFLGRRWLPGETVRLLLRETPFVHGDRELFATASDLGEFVNAEFTPEQHHIGVRFDVTATGMSSGYQATWSFTDAAPASTSYTISSSSQTLLGGGTDIGNHCDDCVTTLSTGSGGALNLPFAITFYNQTFSSIAVGSNGNIQFGTSNAAYVNGCFPDSTFAAGVVAPYWDDLRTDSGGRGIFTQTTGSAPDRAFHVRWNTVYYANPGATAQFEAILYEGRTEVDFVYGNISSLGSASIGIQRTSSGPATNYACSVPSMASGAKLTFTGNGAVTSTSVSASSAPTFGVPVTFTATVSAAGFPAMSGTVTFKEGATTLAGPINVDGSGNATFSTSALSAGSHTITAGFSGNLGQSASAGTATVVVSKAGTVVSFSSNASPIGYGSPLILTAQVLRIPAGLGTRTGTVTFKDGATVVGSAPVDATNTATLTLSPSSGSHAYTADYSGDSNFSPSSSATLVQTVNPAPLLVTADSASRAYGLPNPGFTSSFSGFVAGETLATSGVTGTASLTTTAVITNPPGSYAITAGAGSLAAANYTFTFADGTLTIVKASQAISFAPLADKTYGDPAFAVTANSSSGLPVTLSVLSGPATIAGSTVTLTGSGTVIIRASQAGDANFNPAASVDRSFQVALPDLNVTSITMETRRWNGHVPASSADAVATYDALPLGLLGYATGPKTLTLFDNVSNELTFNGVVSNIGYHHRFAFNAPIAGSLSVRIGADFGAGGTLIIDGVPVQFRNTDMWWGGSYSDPTQYLYGTVALTAGPHTIDSYGFEYCCDGPQQAQYSYLGASYKTFAAPANTVPVVTLSGQTSVTSGTSYPYTFTVSDPDAAASFTVRTFSCGANGVIDGPLTTMPSGGTFNCIFPNAATTSTVSVDVMDNFGAVSNTALRSVTSNKLTQTISLPDPLDTVYGADDFPVSASASSGLPVTIVASGPCALASGSVHINGAGTCVLTASQAGNTTYSAAPNAVQSVTIAPASLTVKADDKSRPYGTANPPLTATISGFVNGEVLATSGVTGAPSLNTVATSTSLVGGYSITATAGTLAAANYTFAYVPGTLTVNAVQLTVIARSANRPYGAGNPDLGTPLSITGFAPGESAAVLSTQPACSTTAIAASPVGSYSVTCSGGAATNYTFAYVSGTLTVDPVQLTVTALSATRPYGAANPDLSAPASIAGFVPGETALVLGTQPTCSTAATPASAVGAYPVVCAGAAAGNYTFAYVNGTLTVAAVPLTVTARSATRAYGAADPDLSTPLSITGFVPGETVAALSAQPTCSTTVTAASPAASYPVTCSGGAATNYSFAYVAGILTVDAVQLSVTGASPNRPYGAANPDVSAPANISGFVLGETASVLATQPTCSTAATPASPVGAYPVVCTGAAAANYTFVYVNGQLTVTAVQLTVTARSANRPYGAENPDLSAPASITGFVLGESAPAFSTQPTCSTSATQASDTGSYPVTCSGGVAANYTFSYVDGSLKVEKVQLTVTGQSPSRGYGALNPDVSAPQSIIGFIAGETAAMLTTQPTCTTSATQASVVGSYPVTCSGAAAANYSFAYVAGTLTVAPVQLTVTAKSNSRLYGAPNPDIAAPLSIIGFVLGETPVVLSAQPACATSATQASPIGSYPVTCGAANAGNYTFTYVAGTLDVTRAPLTVTALNAWRQYSDPTPVLTYAIAGFVNGDTVAVVGGTAGVTTTATQLSPVGNYPIVPSTGSLTAANYSFTSFLDGTLAVVKEDSVATYTGLTYVSTASATSSTAVVTLRATIQDITAVSPGLDGFPGNITTATVQFVNRDMGSAPLCSATLSLLNAADSKTATASCNYTFNIGSADSDSVTIGVIVNGNYTRNSGDDNSVITISKPLTAFITGGGYLVLESSSGTYGGTPASKTNFGFNAKSKGKNTLQGKVNIIIRKNGRVYQIKSTAIDSLSSRAWTSTAPGIGSFQSKGALQDITDPLAPISVAGNLTIQMTFTDNGEPGSADRLALTVWDGETVLFSSRWNGVATVEQLLGGGNVVAR
jgi:hypothetical protein